MFLLFHFYFNFSFLQMFPVAISQNQTYLATHVFILLCFPRSNSIVFMSREFHSLFPRDVFRLLKGFDELIYRLVRVCQFEEWLNEKVLEMHASTFSPWFFSLLSVFKLHFEWLKNECLNMNIHFQQENMKNQ